MSGLPEELNSYEIFYDDGNPNAGVWGPVGYEISVRFSLRSDWEEVKLIAARLYINSNPASFRLHIYSSDGNRSLLNPSILVNPQKNGWIAVDLAQYNLVVSEDFYISAEFISEGVPNIGFNQEDIDLRSYYRHSNNDIWTFSGYDYLIRAVVEPYEEMDESIKPHTSYRTILFEFIITNWLSLLGLSIGFAGLGLAYNYYSKGKMRAR